MAGCGIIVWILDEHKVCRDLRFGQRGRTDKQRHGQWSLPGSWLDMGGLHAQSPRADEPGWSDGRLQRFLGALHQWNQVGELCLPQRP